MYSLEGRKAIVTGSAGGIGRAIPLTLARAGCDVGIFDRDAAGANETADIVSHEYRNAHVALGNVADRGDVDAGAARLIDRLGHVDILVNNAGVLRTRKFLDIGGSEWRD